MNVPDLPPHYRLDPTARHLLIAFCIGLLTGMLSRWLSGGRRHWIFGNVIITLHNGRFQG